MPRSPPSVSGRLLIAVAVPLVLFFALTVGALDVVFRQLTVAALRDLLQEQVVALVTAVDLDRNGNLVVNLLDPESHLDLPGSGQYAALHDEDGKLLWSSPSIAGTGLVLGSQLPVGGEEFRYLRARDGSQIAELSRGLQWEYGAGLTKKLVFTAADSTAPQMRQLWRFRRQMAGWFGALALLLLATMAWMMRRALAPVRRLEQEIGAVEAGAAQQLGEGYPRELAGVTKGLNALLTSERNRIARYRDTLGNLAHSLKTPLAVIRANLGATEVVPGVTAKVVGDSSGGVVVDQEAVAARAAIQLEVDRIAQIVEHQLKRAAAGGGATLGQAPVPVLPVVVELRAALLKVHSNKDLTIDIDVPPDIGFLGDRGDILELLGNLIDNACKWCRARVAVSATLDADRDPSLRLSIAVEDDGPGIAGLVREHIGERGVRSDEHVPGHGIGLAMVRDTVALYGGKVFIDHSVALRGGRVELQLPGR
jgi:two-component system, OmpR family, sensor histidine kinase PhoQ